MKAYKEFRTSVSLIPPHGLGAIKRTGDFGPIRGVLRAITNADTTGFYTFVVDFEKKLRLAGPAKKNLLRVKRLFRERSRNSPHGSCTFCVNGEDLPDESFAAYLQRRIRVTPKLIEILA